MIGKAAFPEVLNAFKVSIRFTLLAVLCVSTQACEDDDACEDTVIDITSLEAEYACFNTSFDLFIDFEDTFNLISSQEDYDAQVSGCSAEIDFERWDLLIGRISLDRGLESLSYSYRRACPGQRYEMRVLIRLTSQVVSPEITYHALIPTLGENEVVDVRIEK